MFKSIKTQKDIQEFLEATNRMHDGHVIGVQYANKGITRTGNTVYYHPEQTVLTLQILVTSIWDTVVEIEFEGLCEWQIYDKFSDIFATTLSFDDEGHIVWADVPWQTHEELKRGSFVIAESMKWQIVKYSKVTSFLSTHLKAKACYNELRKAVEI